MQWRLLAPVMARRRTPCRGCTTGRTSCRGQGSLDRAYDPKLIRGALTAGLATEATLDSPVRRMPRTLFAFRYFDPAPHAEDDSRNDLRAHQRIAQRLEERAIALLRRRSTRHHEAQPVATRCRCRTRRQTST